ncbi:uncharacterized protein LOC131669743 isoform X1 [Phymastichus coffea]|uniref:uncharacterized protein LOC131669743 isoform X1 n=1 Tax=Phymastichus coffea TaxID=108790 RepID=UPI00273C50F9|nr:uncharacterized protein LOC131669743 isoform X1 [Phymastichus coffea]
MRTAVALLLCVALPATFALIQDEINNKLLKIEEDCAKKCGVSLFAIELIRYYQFVPYKEKLSVWAFCMMVKYNVVSINCYELNTLSFVCTLNGYSSQIKKDGTVNMDKMSLKVFGDPDSVRRTFEICKTKTGQDKITLGRTMMNCYLKNYEMVMSRYPRKLMKF